MNTLLPMPITRNRTDQFDYYYFFFQIQINQLKAEKFEMKVQVSKLEDEVSSLKSLISHSLNFNHSNANNPAMPLNAPERNFMRQNSSNRPSLSPSDNQKRRSFPLKYGIVSQDEDNSDILRPLQQQFNEMLNESDNRNFNRNHIAQHHKAELYANTTNDSHESTIVQMEKENLELRRRDEELRRELQDARASNKQADKKIQE